MKRKDTDAAKDVLTAAAKASKPSKATKGGKGKVHHMSIKHVKGGYITTHHQAENADPNEPNEQVHGSMDALLSHIQQNMPEEQQEAAQGGGEPQEPGA